MQTLSNELRSVIEARLRSSSPREILAIASTLCAQEIEIIAAPIAHDVRLQPRYTAGEDVVTDNTTGLMWTRYDVTTKRVNWADAKKATVAAKVGGYDDWRLPTIQELLSLVDYSRSEPAIDPIFGCQPSWYWTGTPLASSPSDLAWLVRFYLGNSSWLTQLSEGFVRAVRPGQIVGNLG